MHLKATGISPLENSRVDRFRFALMGGIFALATLYLAGAISIPFLFESPTMWYKFGLDKVLLRSGKILGVAAAVLLFYQLFLAARLKVLDRVFSLPSLVRAHRLNAIAIFLLAGLHPILVLTSEGALLIPLEMRYWPEWVGVALLACIAVQFTTSQWRNTWKMRFHRWMLVHRWLGAIVLALVILHILFVSETFLEKGLPRNAVILSAVLLALLWLWIRSGSLRAKKRPFTVTRVSPEGKGSLSVELSPVAERSFRYLPGQFVIVSFQSKYVTPEPHPFTLSSTPTRPEKLQLTVRNTGDWTRYIASLALGERAFIQGPFGRFSHVFADADRELIMIAGGIGITPMLSMLRFMADRQDQRPVTLIWSNRTRDDMIYPVELTEIGEKLTGFRAVLTFTIKSENGHLAGRLDAKKLQSVLHNCNRRAMVFVCGPKQMMVQVRGDLKRIGFEPRSIHSEEFGF